MNYKITFPNRISATIKLPASKSISNRALIINAIGGNQCSLSNVSICDDTDAMRAALADTTGNVNIGAAGTAMRFLTGYFAIQEGKTTIIDGSERMRHRPIKILVDALRQCGANITYLGEEGYPPLKIVGKKLAHKGELELPGNVSSQYISSLMMIAPLMEGGLKIRLTGGMLSVPYINMTLEMMRDFGVSGERQDNLIIIPQGSYTASEYTIESDWSGASYWFEIAALLPQTTIHLPQLFQKSLQGDSAVKDIYAILGVDSEFDSNGITLRGRGKTAERLDISLISQPDLAQTVVVTACMLRIPFKIEGLSTLKIKETDRIEALRTELAKYGKRLTVTEDYSLIYNPEEDTEISEPIVIDTYDDHRMAMSFAPTAIKHQGIVINDPQVVSKSYPDFWQHLRHIEATVE